MPPAVAYEAPKMAEISPKAIETVETTYPDWKTLLRSSPELERLAQCESRSSTTVKIIDTNGKYSYSLFQFQEGTFIQQNRIYGILPELEADEFENVIYDPLIQIRLAQKMLDDGKWTNWYNCLKDYHLK